MKSKNNKSNIIREALRECLYTKKENSKEAKLLIQKTLDIIRKESLILPLKQELQYHLNLNKQYKQYLAIIKSIKEEYLTNKNEVQGMCQELKDNFKEFAVIIDTFDNKVVLCNQEKEKIIKTNDEIVNLKNDNKRKLNINLKEIEEKNEIQRQKIEKINNKILQLKKQKDKENEEFLKKEKHEQKKFEKLKKNFEIMKNNLAHYIEENKKYELFNLEMLHDRAISNQILEKEDKEMYNNFYLIIYF